MRMLNYLPWSIFNFLSRPPNPTRILLPWFSPTNQKNFIFLSKVLNHGNWISCCCCWNSFGFQQKSPFGQNLTFFMPSFQVYSKSRKYGGNCTQCLASEFSGSGWIFGNGFYAFTWFRRVRTSKNQVSIYKCLKDDLE